MHINYRGGRINADKELKSNENRARYSNKSSAAIKTARPVRSAYPYHNGRDRNKISHGSSKRAAAHPFDSQLTTQDVYDPTMSTAAKDLCIRSSSANSDLAPYKIEQ